MNDTITIEEINDNRPEWVEELFIGDIEAIIQGGCASSAYMPAVTYHVALDTMSEYGDEILEFIENNLGEIPQPKQGESWSGIAVFYLSMAVELWAAQYDSYDITEEDEEE